VVYLLIGAVVLAGAGIVLGPVLLRVWHILVPIWVLEIREAHLRRKLRRIPR
jgi:hypothetical protein